MKMQPRFDFEFGSHRKSCLFLYPLDWESGSLPFQKKDTLWQCRVITHAAWLKEQDFCYLTSPGTWFSPAPEPQVHTLL